MTKCSRGWDCAEIAFECGFGRVQHFNRVFRRFENASPGEWRAGGEVKPRFWWRDRFAFGRKACREELASGVF